MQVLKLEVFQYRNLGDAETVFAPGTNIFVGRNGQGKTNLLEAIYLLGYGKSFRTANPRECIRHGLGECRVDGVVQHGSISRTLQVLIGAGEKKLLIHGKTVTLEEFLGSLHISAFTSEHLNIVRGASAERRAFLDRAMVTIYPGHVRRLAAYSRALKQRNRVLAVGRDSRAAPDEGLLDSWDETLVREGAPVVRDRLSYVHRMKLELPSGLFGAESLKFHYTSVLPDDQPGIPEIEEAFRQRLARSRSNDTRVGFTTVGPHRDDLKVFLNGKPLADFGSAGQQRSSLLSLYFAQMEIHRKVHGFYPVFLVDDVEAELDDARLRAFIVYLSDRTQTFLTTAKEGLLPVVDAPMRRFEIVDGSVSG